MVEKRERGGVGTQVFWMLRMRKSRCVADVLRMYCECVADVKVGNLDTASNCTLAIARAEDTIVRCSKREIRFFLLFFSHSFFSRCMYADKALYSELLLSASYSDL